MEILFGLNEDEFEGEECNQRRSAVSAVERPLIRRKCNSASSQKNSSQLCSNWDGGAKGMRLPFSWTVVVALATALSVTDPATSQESQHSARQIQQALADHGYDLGTADGIWGRRSISALKAFQKANNLPQTGTLDEATSAALFPRPQVTRGPLTPIATQSPPSLLKKPGVPTKTTLQTGHGEARQADGDVHQAPPLAAHTEGASAKSDRLEPEPNKVGEAPTTPTARLIYLGLLAVATAFFFLRRRRRKPGADPVPARSGSKSSEPDHGLDRSIRSSRYRLRIPNDRVVPASIADRRQPVEQTPILSPNIAASIAAHNAAVHDFIRQRGAIRRPKSGANPSARLQAPPAKPSWESLEATKVTPVTTTSDGSLASHNAQIAESIRNRDPVLILPTAATDQTQPSGSESKGSQLDNSLDQSARSNRHLLVRNDVIVPANIAVRRQPVEQKQTLPSDIATSVAAHNKAVHDFIRQRGAFGPPEPAPNPSAAPAAAGWQSIEDTKVAPAAPTIEGSLASHNAQVSDFIPQRGPILVPNTAVSDQPRWFDRLPPVRASPAASQAHWIPANSATTVGSHNIRGGMIYVGEHLPRQGSSVDAENCLIDPRLTVAARGDPLGQTMGYWPSYSRISPAARKSYLDWLAGSRSDPEAYIGYVFLYFYGLEQRLMLDESPADADGVVAEVRRLLQVYGGNGSFKRYAGELLSAYQLKSAQLPEKLDLEVEENSYDIPIMLKVALGMRVRSGDPIEPDLLLAYVIADPETRVRTPARRAQTVLRGLFAEAVEKKYPNGVRVAAAGVRKLKVNYRACSGTFDLDIRPLGGDLPDITNRSEPIGGARRIFDDCTDRLDDYSRMLGRSEGLRPTLAAVAQLPLGLRVKNAEELPGQPLSRLRELVSDGALVSIQQLAQLAGMEPGKIATRAKQKELSGILAALGYGNTADPCFSLKSAKPDALAMVFALEREAEADPEPGQHYRPMQLSIMLGMVVAFADGLLHPLEERRLFEKIDEAPGLSRDERVRLKAELKVCAADAGRVLDWTKRIGDVPADRREDLADELVAVAAADGTLHAREVSQLEKLFRQMGLDENSLYSRLHGSVAPQNRPRDGNDDLPLVIPAGIQPPGIPVSPASASAPATRVDISRLEAIRRETRSTSSVLADIFMDEAEPPIELQPAIEEIETSNGDARFDGLERRYAWLLSQLIVQETWTASDFERLVRNADLMPGAAKQALNDWSLDRFDELVLDGDDPVIVNPSLFSESTPQSPSLTVSVEGLSA
ncbi:TerB N-terminal domain-containing protein [Mesorhizobium sp. M0046]|uniref:TerB N-terminal domain-containing protein n=1 Tax=Mesorhizobium sp. M0046 TaxID=2956858 RepID=UPI00333536DB